MSPIMMMATLMIVAVGLACFASFNCSAKARLFSLASASSLDVCVWSAVNLLREDWRLLLVSCIFSRLFENSACCCFCCNCIFSSVLPCRDSLSWSSLLVLAAASICNLACFCDSSLAFRSCSVCFWTICWADSFAFGPFAGLIRLLF